MIEDACHALGAKYKVGSKAIKVGSCKHSDMTVFSFHPVKSITTGEGGAILTNNHNLYRQLVSLRTHGIVKKSNFAPWYYEMTDLGFNYRVTDFQCALGINQLKKVDCFISKRRQVAKVYTKELSTIKEIILPHKEALDVSSWHLYVIHLKNGSENVKEKLFEHLRSKGIGVQVHYMPAYWHPYYQKLGYKKKKCVNSEQFYKGAISLPIYPSIKNKEIDYVVKTIKGFFNK